VTEHADPVPHRSAIDGEIDTQHLGGTPGHRQQTGAQPQQARLAGPVGAPQQDDLTPGDVEGDACQRRETTEHRHRVHQVDDDVGRLGGHASVDATGRHQPRSLRR